MSETNFEYDILKIPRPTYLGGGEWNLQKLSPITVILGRNGSGKSQLLRSIKDMNSEKRILSILKQGEGKTIEFKTQEIISDGHKLAKLFVAFANNKSIKEEIGGQILVGIKDESKKVIGVKYESKHEETIMNIAREKCIPPIEPIFEKVEVDKKVIYLISIPKMTNLPFQLKTKEGNVHFIRVGSTVRPPTPDELSNLYQK